MNPNSTSEKRRKSRTLIKHRRNHRNKRIKKAKQETQASNIWNLENSERKFDLKFKFWTYYNFFYHFIFFRTGPNSIYIPSFNFKLFLNSNSYLSRKFLIPLPLIFLLFECGIHWETPDKFPSSFVLRFRGTFVSRFRRSISSVYNGPLPPGAYTVGPHEIDLEELRSIISRAPPDHCISMYLPGVPLPYLLSQIVPVRFFL